MRTLIFIILSIVLHTSYAAPTLTIQNGSVVKVFTRTQLLAMKQHRLSMNQSRAYLNKHIEYTAVRICDLLKPFNVNKHGIVEFISSDDFYALVPAKFLLDCTKTSSIAYVAIEQMNKPWPKLTYNNPDARQPNHGSAGPFAVVWTNPEKNYISNEYWAWKIVRMNIHKHINSNAIIAAPQHVRNEIRNGYHTYASRCAGCHTINKIGKAKIGADLNQPINATDRFANDEQLKRFIRDPQSVRKKANDRMSGTNERYLSEKDLNDLLRYFHYLKRLPA